MSPERFIHHLFLVQERISNSRENYQQSLSCSFRIGRQSVGPIVVETCKAIYLSLKDIYLKSPEFPE